MKWFKWHRKLCGGTWYYNVYRYKYYNAYRHEGRIVAFAMWEREKAGCMGHTIKTEIY